jgi:hypothetical protein
MHKHSFSNIISKLFSNCHCAWLKSCVDPSSNVWFFPHPIIPSCRMTFNIFYSTLRTKLGLSHLIAHGLSQCICDQAINTIGIHLLPYAHGGEHMATHDVIQYSFASIANDVMFHALHKQTHVLPLGQ